MTPTNSISIRLSRKKQQVYEAEAKARDVPLRTYLRERLENNEDLLQEIIALRKAIEELSNVNNSNLEMLLLLRQIAQPHKVQSAQQELKRFGFNIWNGEAE